MNAGVIENALVLIENDQTSVDVEKVKREKLKIKNFQVKACILFQQYGCSCKTFEKQSRKDIQSKGH